jgi:hypothetical protein
MKRIFIFGIRRSGLHVISDWVTAQFPGSKFHNNVALPHLLNGNQPKATEGTQVFLFEDHEPNQVMSILRETEGLRTQLGVSKAEDGGWKALLVLRDPFNLFASRIAHYGLLSAKRRWVDAKQAVHLWPRYADAFAELYGDESGPILPVSYNQFISNSHHRRSLSKTLGGMIWTDESLLRVNPNGQGSSFDHLRHDGSARSMRVFKRWEAYRDVDAFWKLFTPDIRVQALRAFPTAKLLPFSITAGA